jgi:hypothetical protein
MRVISLCPVITNRLLTFGTKLALMNASKLPCLADFTNMAIEALTVLPRVRFSKWPFPIC